MSDSSSPRGTPRKQRRLAACSSSRRAAAEALPPRHCCVPGCAEPLGFGGYHYRYRVCAPHSRAPSVELNGAPHRFCQQVGARSACSAVAMLRDASTCRAPFCKGVPT